MLGRPRWYASVLMGGVNPRACIQKTVTLARCRCCCSVGRRNSETRPGGIRNTWTAIDLSILVSPTHIVSVTCFKLISLEMWTTPKRRVVIRVICLRRDASTGQGPLTAVISRPAIHLDFQSLLQLSTRKSLSTFTSSTTSRKQSA